MLGLHRKSFVHSMGALATQVRFRHLNPVPFSTTPEEFVSNGKPSIHDPPSVKMPGDIVDVNTIVRNYTSFPGVGFNAVLQMPIYQFEVPDIQEVDDSRTVILPNDIFGAPIRKDLVHYAYWFHRRAMAGYTMRMQLTAAEFPGSKKKLRSQKKSGKARMGWRKAPGKYVGVQAHPLRPHNQRQDINRKVIYQSMKTMLSAKYLDGSLMVVNDFRLSSHKTKYAVRSLRRLVGYRCNSALLVHEGTSDINDNFRFATAHISAVRRENVSTLSVYTLLRYRKIIMTEKALETLIQSLEQYPEEQGWLPKHATPDGLPAPVPEKVRGWDQEWRQQKEEERRNEFTRLSLWKRMRDWRWTNTTKGAFKVQRHDPFRGFRLLDAQLEPYVPAWATSEQIVYHDEEPLDMSSTDLGDEEDIRMVREQLEEREAMLETSILGDSRKAIRGAANLREVATGQYEDEYDVDDEEIVETANGTLKKNANVRVKGAQLKGESLVDDEEEAALRNLEEELDDLDFESYSKGK